MIGGLISTALSSGLETVSGDGLIAGALCTRRTKVKTKNITVSVYCVFHNYFSADMLVFGTSYSLNTKFHCVVLDKGDKVLYNSVAKSTNFKNSYSFTLAVPDLDKEYDYDIKAKVIAGFDVDDDFYTYTVRVKPNETRYGVLIGHNLYAHLYKFHAEIVDDMIPLTTLSYGVTGGVSIEGYQTERIECTGYCYTFDEEKVVYQSDDSWRSPSVFCVSADCYEQHYGGALHVGDVYALRKDKPTLSRGGLTYRAASYIFTFRDYVDTKEVKRGKSETDIKDTRMQAITGYSIATELPEEMPDLRVFNYVAGTKLDSSNAVFSANSPKGGELAYSILRLKEDASSYLPHLMRYTTDILESQGEDKIYFGVNYAAIIRDSRYDGDYNVYIGFESNVKKAEFDPEDVNGEVADYWEVGEYTRDIAPKYKTQQCLHACQLIQEGVISSVSIGNMPVYVWYNNKGNLIFGDGTPFYIEHSDRELDIYYAGTCVYVSDDFEHWLPDEDEE